MKENIRINKALAQAGVCSRRKADEFIAAGAVMVNDEVAQPGMSIDPVHDVVFVNGKKIYFGNTGEGQGVEHSYILLHKPIEVVSTVRDPEGRRTVLDTLPGKFKIGKDGIKKRLYPVGRLDYFSEGLIMLTDDGELTHRLTHPGFNLPRVYLVTVRGLVSEAKLEKMRRGMTLSEGEHLAPMEVEILPPVSQNDLRYGQQHPEQYPEQPLRHSGGDAQPTYGDSNTGNGRESRHSLNAAAHGTVKNKAKDIVTLRMTLTQGLNRQIRRVCRDLQLTILRLCRISHGPLQLGDLKTGSSRFLSEREVNELRQVVGLLEKDKKQITPWK